jgi:hypothetical protein
MAENFEPPKDGEILRIAGLVRAGAEYSLAIAAIGIPERQAAEWQALAVSAGEKNEEGPYLDLYNAVREATAQCEVIALQRILTEGGASGARWLLEKLRPEKYGKSQEPPPAAAKKRISTPQKKAIDIESVIDWDNL